MIAQILVPIYILLTIGIALSKKTETNDISYIFAGRKLTVPAFVMTLVATWYGGILEIGRFTYEHGVVSWFVFGVFYYIAALLYAIILVPKISSYNFSSIPDAFAKSFGKECALVAALVMLFVVSPAPYLKILSIILDYIYEIGPLNAIIIGALLSMLYTIKGGFSSVVGTDKLQFSLMYIGFGTVLVYLYMNYGGYDFLYSHLPEEKLSIPGNLNWGYIFAWGFIAMVTLIDPNFYQRCFAGSSKKNIQKGIYISVILWFIFDLMSISVALYAAAILPEIQTSPYLDLMSMVLSPFLQGIFIISMLSVVMSTIDSFVFVSGFTIGKDILSNVLNKKSIDSVYYTRIGIVVTGLISVVLATFFKNAMDIWYVSGSFGVSAILIPLLCIFYNQKLHYPLLMIMIPIVVTFFWFIFSPYNLDPMYPGLLSSFICFLLLRR